MEIHLSREAKGWMVMESELDVSYLVLASLTRGNLRA